MMDLKDEERDAVEVAALLHDIGVIGVPDQILLKPGPLDRDESRAVELARQMTLDILQSACAEPLILQIVENVGAWHDGSKGRYRVKADKIPRGARMISIVEAFDSMTTDQVFRSAMSLERAVAELFAFAGTQFDPELVQQFAQLVAEDQTRIRREVAGRWLHKLDPETVNSFWELNTSPTRPRRSDAESPFEGRLLENMHDAVVFIDASLRVSFWNHGAERLTGISNSSVCHRQWSSELLKMQSEKGDAITVEDCPVANAIYSGVQSLRRLTVSGRSGAPVAVDTHTIPVVTNDGTALGAILLLHDASSEISLEKRCQNLHEKATKDPMTQVANRAEFDRVLELFVNTHRQQQVPCSLIICDLDHFKQVNDNFGHPAGDEAIKSLATILKNSCRPGDLVARYGGEEFVLLYADCDNASATRRAERVRKELAKTEQSELGGRSVTASFGVTEIQPGDTPETMLRRADRGLLMAKAKGRNNVVQLGSGSQIDPRERSKGPRRKRASRTETTIQQTLLTPVPIAVSIEKLRGFVADHQAQIEKIDGTRVKLKIVDPTRRERRHADRPVPFSVELRFQEDRSQAPESEASSVGAILRTKILVTIRPTKSRDRRRRGVNDRARQVLASIRSYLMASLDDGRATQDPTLQAANGFIPWPPSQ